MIKNLAIFAMAVGARLLKEEVREAVAKGLEFDDTNLYDMYLGAATSNPGLGSGKYVSESQVSHVVTQLLLSYPDLFRKVHVPNSDQDRTTISKGFQ